jgi:hypothetical protein
MLVEVAGLTGAIMVYLELREGKVTPLSGLILFKAAALF